MGVGYVWWEGGVGYVWCHCLKPLVYNVTFPEHCVSIV